MLPLVLEGNTYKVHYRRQDQTINENFDQVIGAEVSLNDSPTSFGVAGFYRFLELNVIKYLKTNGIIGRDND